MAPVRVGRAAGHWAFVGRCRELAPLGVEGLFPVSQVVCAAERADGEGLEASARRLFGLPPEMVARGVALLAELEALVTAGACQWAVG